MVKQDLEKEERPEIKSLMLGGLWKDPDNITKMYSYASLATAKHLIMWSTQNYETL